jgi:hypothetical protein
MNISHHIFMIILEIGDSGFVNVWIDLVRGFLEAYIV